MTRSEESTLALDLGVVSASSPPKPYEDPWRNAPNYTAQWLKHAKVYDRHGEQLVAEMRTYSDIPHLFPDFESMRDYVRFKSGRDHVGSVWHSYRKWVRETLGWKEFDSGHGRSWLRKNFRRV